LFLLAAASFGVGGLWARSRTLQEVEDALLVARFEHMRLQPRKHPPSFEYPPLPGRLGEYHSAYAIYSILYYVKDDQTCLYKPDGIVADELIACCNLDGPRCDTEWR